MEALLDNFQQTIQNQYVLSYIVVFLAGLVSAVSPCVLAAIPLIIGYVGGYSEGNRKKAALYSLVFVLGLSITFTVLGIAASYIGQFLALLGNALPVAISAIAILMGIHLLGILTIPMPFQRSREVKTRGIAGAFLLGLLTGAVSSPCATPVLAVILAYVSAKGNMFYGGTLLFTYAVGHCALIFIAGLSIGLTESIVSSRGTIRFSLWLRRLSGAILIVAGVYFIITVI